MNTLDQHTLLQGIRELTGRDQDFARVIEKYGPPPLWEREPGFQTLVNIILEQQVSLASAQAAFNKLAAAVELLTPRNFLKLSDEELKKIGFSRQKTTYARALSNALLDNSLDLHGLNKLDDEEARERLMKVKGIGPWTADIYLLMALGRPDIWPKGDLALEAAIQQVKGLPHKPNAKESILISCAWRPWRAVAARILWHFYLSEREK